MRATARLPPAPRRRSLILGPRIAGEAVDVELDLDLVHPAAWSGGLVADGPVRADNHFVLGVNVVLETASSELSLCGVEPQADHVRDTAGREGPWARAGHDELDRARAPTRLRMLLADLPMRFDDEHAGAAPSHR